MRENQQRSEESRAGGDIIACNLWRAHDPPTFIFYITHKEVINLLGYVFATIVRCRHGYAATPLYGTNVITKATTVARECVSSPF